MLFYHWVSIAIFCFCGILKSFHFNKIFFTDQKKYPVANPYLLLLQVLKKDHVAAGLCCIQLFMNSSSLEEAVKHLEHAKVSSFAVQVINHAVISVSLFPLSTHNYKQFIFSCIFNCFSPLLSLWWFQRNLLTKATWIEFNSLFILVIISYNKPADLFNQKEFIWILF